MAIGRAYYLGIGLEQDHQKSKYWFSRAADNEEPKSIKILAKLGWADSDIDTSLAPDFEGKPGSNAVVMKAIGLTVKLTGRRLHKAPFC
ncbi:MAG: TPR repeat protein [Arenicella sp.]